MKPVDQIHTQPYTETGTAGDCWRACLASLLHLDCEALPNFIHDQILGEQQDADYPKNHWWTLSRRFVETHSRGELDLHWEELYRTTLKPIPRLEGYVSERGEYGLQPGIAYDVNRYGILTGRSPRGDWHHSVVVDLTTGKMVHDPHPSRDGVKSHADIAVLARRRDTSR